MISPDYSNGFKILGHEVRWEDLFREQQEILTPLVNQAESQAEKFVSDYKTGKGTEVQVLDEDCSDDPTWQPQVITFLY